MCDQQKRYYTANWIVKFEQKSFVPGVSGPPLYLTNAEAIPLLKLGVIFEVKNSNKLLFNSKCVQ
jgi:hypothetical protein